MDNSKHTLDPEKFRRTSRQAALASAVGAIVVFGSLGYGAVKLQDLTQTLKAKREELEKVEVDLRTKKEEAEQKKKQLEEVTKKLDDTRNALDYAAVQLGESNYSLARQALVRTIESNPDTGDIVPRIYIHIRSESQKRKTRQIAENLKEKGYDVPGIEIMVDKGPRNTQVRYFRNSEENEAAEFVDILKELGVKDVKIQYIKGYEISPVVRRRNYEIWFGHSSLGER